MILFLVQGIIVYVFSWCIYIFTYYIYIYIIYIHIYDICVRILCGSWPVPLGGKTVKFPEMTDEVNKRKTVKYWTCWTSTYCSRLARTI